MNVAALDPLVLVLAAAASVLFVGGGALLRRGPRAERTTDDFSEDQEAIGVGAGSSGAARAARPGAAELAAAKRDPALADAEQAADAWLMTGSSPGDHEESSAASAAGASGTLSRQELERSLRIAEQALAVATAQLAEAAAEREVHRADAATMRQQLARQNESSADDARRLTNAIDAERAKLPELERASQRDRARIAELERELAKLRESPPAPAASAAPPASEGAEARARALADLQQRLTEALAERDAARSRAEAVERLMEGVRARSRQLAEELKTLKARAGGDGS